MKNLISIVSRAITLALTIFPVLFTSIALSNRSAIIPYHQIPTNFNLFSCCNRTSVEVIFSVLSNSITNIHATYKNDYANCFGVQTSNYNGDPYHLVYTYENHQKLITIN